MTKKKLERKIFIESDKSKNCPFDGSFLAEKNHHKLEDYKNYTFCKAYFSSVFLAKTQKLNFIFNILAVHDCDGWNLAESLELVKTVISIPLSKGLPIDLEDRKTIYIAKNKEELNLANDLLINDTSYRNILAKEYKD